MLIFVLEKSVVTSVEVCISKSYHVYFDVSRSQKSTVLTGNMGLTGNAKYIRYRICAGIKEVITL